MIKESIFYELLQKSKYGKEYLNLVEQCRDRSLDHVVGFQLHHIFPRSLKGSNDPSNLVRFSIYEHVKAHYLLALFGEEIGGLEGRKLLYAFGMMSSFRGDLKTIQDPNLREAARLLENLCELRKSTLHTKESQRRSKEILTELYGSSTGAMHTPEAIEKARQTKIRRYGSSAGALSLQEVKKKRKQTIIQKYGTCTGAMNTPEARAKSLETRKKNGTLCCISQEARLRGIQTALRNKKEKYGDSAYQLRTPEALRRNYEVRMEKFGSLAGHINNPKSKAKSLESRKVLYENRRKVCMSEEFQQWWQENSNRFKRKDWSVSSFLQEKGKTFVDFG